MKQYAQLPQVMILLLSIFWVGSSLAVQAASAKTYASEDRAVQFTYHDDWTIESQSVTFNERYHYELWTLSNELAEFFGNEDRSRMEFDIVNPATAGYPRTVISPLDYANYTLEDQILESSETEVAGYPAVRAIPAHPAMPPSPTITIQENFGDPVTATPKPTQLEPHAGRFYAIVRDDGWVILINLAAPAAEVQIREQQALQMVQSLVFNADAAATPFQRNLEVYDVSHIRLARTYSSSDGILSLEYPADWKIDHERQFNFTMGDPIIAYGVPFAPPDNDAEIHIMVMDVTSEGIGAGANMDTGEEFMQMERQATEGERKQYRIGGFDAVFVIYVNNEANTEEFIELALNNVWVATGFIKAESREQVTKYEAQVTAILESLQFPLGSPTITSPVLNISLPEPWILYSMQQDEGRWYNFKLQTSNVDVTDNAFIIIELVDLVANGLTYISDTDDLKNNIPNIGTISDQPSVRYAGSYEVVSVLALNEEYGFFIEFNSLLANDDWLIAIYGVAYSEDEAHNTLPCIDAIITDMELTLPDE